MICLQRVLFFVLLVVFLLQVAVTPAESVAHCVSSAGRTASPQDTFLVTGKKVWPTFAMFFASPSAGFFSNGATKMRHLIAFWVPARILSSPLPIRQQDRHCMRGVPGHRGVFF